MGMENIIELLMACLFFGTGTWYFISYIERKDRARIRAQYADLIKEKLDVLKTALAMGYQDSEIVELDRRLDKVVGTEKMLSTLRSPDAAEVAQQQQLSSADLLSEIDLLRHGRQVKDTAADRIPEE